MVNAGFVVQISLFATIIMENIWPPQWIEGNSVFSSLSTCIVYTLFWLLVHLFITWQLQNKIVASLYVNGYENALRKLTFENITQNDLSINEAENKKPEFNLFTRWIGKIIPLKSPTQRYDINTKGLPSYISNSIISSMAQGTAAKGHERLLVLASLLIWILTMIRMFSHYIFN